MGTNDTLVEIKKFFKKLIAEIETRACFSFLGTRYVNKSRIDDILCCIEANFPEKLKKRKDLKSMQFYRELLRVVKHKCFFSNTLYAIAYGETRRLIDYTVMNFKKDFEYLDNQEDSMF